MKIYPQMVAFGAAFLVGLAPQAGWTDDDDECVEEYDVDLFTEINATDGDAGIQLKLDGEQWIELEIEDPRGREILHVKAKRSIRRQGLTEFFFESAEPTFDEQSLASYLKLFPEGEYEFEGELRDGDEICGTAEFTHNLPAAPMVGAELDPDGNLVISWVDGEGSFQVGGVPEQREIVVESYEVIAEVIDGDVDFRMVLPADEDTDSYQVTLPPEFLDDADPGATVKYEVLCKEESGNQTITEATFVLP